MIAAANSLANNENKEKHLLEMHRDFFLSPSEKKAPTDVLLPEEIADNKYAGSHGHSVDKKDSLYSSIIGESLKKKLESRLLNVKSVKMFAPLIKKTMKRVNWDNSLGPDIAKECLEDA